VLTEGVGKSSGFAPPEISGDEQAANNAAAMKRDAKREKIMGGWNSVEPHHKAMVS
jgi:hypothetical protein